MNRPAPLVVRKFRNLQASAAGRWDNLPQDEAEKDPLSDLKLFATGWLAGLVFFGTYLS